ncbi:MAG: b(o/a)3-type cytochrome-c oxidase subunit 1 [Firmicutes bacterium]|nr:b(o/a)3-type cytochrome-c oxidase subunit 1 [Bacillota bacterium]
MAAVEVPSSREAHPEKQGGPFSKPDANLSLAHFIVVFVALVLGGIAGALQAEVRSGTLTLPAGIDYYALLTLHGVVMALVVTTYFIVGFLLAFSGHLLGGELKPTPRLLGWIGFIVMTLGTAMAAIEILLGNASVLYTFYAPMQASPWFYVGVTLLIVGSWISGAAIFVQYHLWRKEHPGERSPLGAFMAVCTFILWDIATLGVAIESLFQLIPWSFGLTKTINVELSRTFFWYFGHPLVYFWLLPAYIVWYTVIPKIVGGKVFSDTLARFAFLLFILFSVPVGFHHQLMDPGIQSGWKFVQVVLTMMVVIPSLMTAYALFATFIRAGRAKGQTGFTGWLKAMPWGDVRFLAPFIGMVGFIFGGAGGIINASNQMNAMVHNTLWVTGHFHETLALTVILTFFGASYWLLPALSGRKLTPQMNKLGILQTILWTVGMVIMSGAMHAVGLLGAPRRTSYTTYQNNPLAQTWVGYEQWMAIGGIILFIGLALMVYNAFRMIYGAPKGYTEVPVADIEEEAGTPPAIFEKWWLWIGITVVLVLIAYFVPVTQMIQNAGPGSPGFNTWNFGR